MRDAQSLFDDEIYLRYVARTRHRNIEKSKRKLRAAVANANAYLLHGYG